MAESADADITFTVDPVTLNRLKRNSRLAVASISLPRTIVIKLNCALPVFSDSQVRKAFSDGLDREGIAHSVMRMKDSTAYQLFPEALGRWHLDALNHRPPPGTGFKALLLARGWTENKRGYLEKDGKLCELTMRTYSDRPELPVVATALQDQMRKMGVKLNVSVTNASAIAQGHQDGKLEMGLVARNYGLIPTPLGTILQDYGPGGGDWGAMNWSNESMQSALSKLQQATTPGKQTRFIEAIITILNREMPIIPVVSYQHTAVLSNEIGGFTLDPLERSYRINELYWRENQ